MRLPRPRQRSLPALLGRLLVVRLTVWAAVAAAMLVGTTIGTALNTQGSPLPPEETPGWDAADTRAFPGCLPSSLWDADRIPSSLVVHRHRDDQHVRLSFDRAWRLNHNGTEVDDVHVLGSCG